ncbi:MAG: hypothetical protein HKP27_02345 [Myxococcales bacterium]|nr:hypothetical protein [Myxococcales bacterium]
MNPIERFGAYAAAFEETFADDDWSRLELSYGKDGAPDLTIQGSERASYRGDRIVPLEDVFDPGCAKAVGDYMAAHFG